MDKVNILEVLTILIGIYEVLSRSIPTSKTWSLIGLILKAIHNISEKLDNNAKQREQQRKGQ